MEPAEEGRAGTLAKNKKEFVKLLHKKARTGIRNSAGSLLSEGAMAANGGVRISLLQKDGKMAKNAQTPVLGGEGSIGELLRAAGREQGDWSKLDNFREGGLESSQANNLHDILGIRNNGSSGNSEFAGGFELRIGELGSTDAKSLIGKIADYLIQNGIKNLDFLEVIVDHEELGKFKIDAQKTGINGQIDLKIEAMSSEAQDFFRDNESLLLKNLARSGININDFKIIDLKEGISPNLFFAEDASGESDLEPKNDENHSPYDREGENEENGQNPSQEEFLDEEENDDRNR